MGENISQIEQNFSDFKSYLYKDYIKYYELTELVKSGDLEGITIPNTFNKNNIYGIPIDLILLSEYYLSDYLYSFPYFKDIKIEDLLRSSSEQFTNLIYKDFKTFNLLITKCFVIISIIKQDKKFADKMDKIMKNSLTIQRMVKGKSKSGGSVGQGILSNEEDPYIKKLYQELLLFVKKIHDKGFFDNYSISSKFSTSFRIPKSTELIDEKISGVSEPDSADENDYSDFNDLLTKILSQIASLSDIHIDPASFYEKPSDKDVDKGIPLHFNFKNEEEDDDCSCNHTDFDDTDEKIFLSIFKQDNLFYGEEDDDDCECTETNTSSFEAKADIPNSDDGIEELNKYYTNSVCFKLIPDEKGKGRKLIPNNGIKLEDIDFSIDNIVRKRAISFLSRIREIKQHMPDIFEIVDDYVNPGLTLREKNDLLRCINSFNNIIRFLKFNEIPHEEIYDRLKVLMFGSNPKSINLLERFEKELLDNYSDMFYPTTEHLSESGGGNKIKLKKTKHRKIKNKTKQRKTKQRKTKHKKTKQRKTKHKKTKHKKTKQRKTKSKIKNYSGGSSITKLKDMFCETIEGLIPSSINKFFEDLSNKKFLKKYVENHKELFNNIKNGTVKKEAIIEHFNTLKNDGEKHFFVSLVFHFNKKYIILRIIKYIKERKGEDLTWYHQVKPKRENGNTVTQWYYTYLCLEESKILQKIKNLNSLPVFDYDEIKNHNYVRYFNPNVINKDIIHEAVIIEFLGEGVYYPVIFYLNLISGTAFVREQIIRNNELIFQELIGGASYMASDSSVLPEISPILKYTHLLDEKTFEKIRLTEYQEYARKNKNRIALISYSYIFDGPLRQFQNSGDLYYFFNDDSKLPIIFKLAFVFIPLACYGNKSNMDEFFTQEYIEKYRGEIEKIKNNHNVSLDIDNPQKIEAFIKYTKKFLRFNARKLFNTIVFNNLKYDNLNFNLEQWDSEKPDGTPKHRDDWYATNGYVLDYYHTLIANQANSTYDRSFWNNFYNHRYGWKSKMHIKRYKECTLFLRFFTCVVLLIISQEMREYILKYGHTSLETVRIISRGQFTKHIPLFQSDELSLSEKYFSDGILYRGSDNQVQLTPNTGFTDLSFISSSYKLQVAARFAKCHFSNTSISSTIFVIHKIENLAFVGLTEHITSYFAEHEILFNGPLSIIDESEAIDEKGLREVRKQKRLLQSVSRFIRTRYNRTVSIKGMDTNTSEVLIVLVKLVGPGPRNPNPDIKDKTETLSKLPDNLYSKNNVVHSSINLTEKLERLKYGYHFQKK